MILAALFFFALAVALEQLEAEAQHSFLAEVFIDAFSQDFAHVSAADKEPMDAKVSATDKSNEFFIVETEWNGALCVVCAIHPKRSIKNQTGGSPPLESGSR